MRSMKRLRNTDFKKIQTSLKQKTQKEIQTLTNLMQLPDFDVIEFFQTLMKNQNYDQIITQIPEQKKIDFFSKNYATFLETQDQLLSLKLPELKQIPKAKEFHFKMKQQQTIEQNVEQASVIQIIDSFSTHILRIYRIIMEMKQHNKYKDYFYSYSINKIFRQSYISFIQNCNDIEILIKLNEQAQAIKVYFHQKEVEIFEKINTDLKIDSSVHSLKKTLSFLLNQIQENSQKFKVKFARNLQKDPELALYLSKWIHQLAKTYYQAVQGFIYEQDQISDILKNLSEILETSKQIQSKGISLYRQLRNLISVDLPIHLQKIIEVILQSFDDILKYNNDVYEFVQFKTLSSIHEFTNSLTLVGKKDYGKKCCSQKGILLINSFLIILLPLCDEKWAFLHQNILQSIIDKVKAMIEQQKIKLPLWDYYHLFWFFYQLGQGKVRHKILFQAGSASYLKQKIVKIKKIADQCRYVFQNKLIINFWTQSLSQIPQLLWQFKTYAQQQQKTTLKPTVFSIAIIFGLEQFFKQIEFRISKQHYQYLGIQFYQYLIYVVEYIIFWGYHDKGANQKVFTLYKKDKKYLIKAKELFTIEQLPIIKSSKILKISNFTKFGLERFVVDWYFISDIYQILLNGCEKIKCEDFLFKVSTILTRQKKNELLQTKRAKYSELLKQFSEIYEKKPQLIKKYLNQKRLASSSSSPIVRKNSKNSEF